MSPELDRVLAAVRAKDEAPFRQHAFDYLAGHNRAVAVARGVHRALPRRLRTALVAAYGAAAAVRTAPPPPAPVVSAVRYRNERRQVDQLATDGELGIATVELDAGPRSWAAAARALMASDARRALRAAASDADFLVACRLAESVGRFVALRGRLPPQARVALVSSDTNPYAVALVAAAREAGLKVAFVNHGHLPEGPPPLDVDLAILDGEALLDVYRRAGPVRADVVFRGSEGEYRPLCTAGLKSGLRLGVFASLLVDWRQLGRRIEQLRAATEASSILLRLHPNTTIRDPDWAAHVDLRPADRVSDGARVLLADAADCDLVVAGNSSCHLSVLKHGVPTVQVPDLDVVPHDFYRFRIDRIVPFVDDPNALDLAGITAFYGGDWPDRFALYDAGYPGRDNAARRDAADALRRLAGLPERAP